jgi:hypothetical protein
MADPADGPSPLADYVTRGPIPPGVRRRNPLRGRLAGEALLSGWFAYRDYEPAGMDGFETDATLIATSAGGLALGAFSPDRASDFAYLLAISAARTVAAVVNSETASLVEADWYLRRCVEAAGTTAWIPVIAARLAEWANEAGATIAPREFEQLLTRQWDFPDHAFFTIVDRLGLMPAKSMWTVLKECSGAGFVLLGKHSAPPAPEIDSEKTRYVLGWGKDYHGIWDRSHPGPAIHTFPFDDTGHHAAHELWLQLVSDPAGSDGE